MSSVLYYHAESLRDRVEQTLMKRKRHIYNDRDNVTLKQIRRELEQDMHLPMRSLDAMKDSVRDAVDGILQEEVDALRRQLMTPLLASSLLF